MGISKNISRTEQVKTTLLNTWKKISYLGITEDLEASLQLKIKILNQVLGASLVVNFINIIIVLLAGDFLNAATYFGTAFWFIIILFLNHKKKYYFNFHVFVSFGFLQVIASLFLGTFRFDYFLFYFPLLGLLFFLFDSRKVIFIYVLLYLGTFAFLIFYPSEDMDVFRRLSEDDIITQIFIITLLSTIIVLAVSFEVQKTYEKKLANNQLELKKALHQLQLQNNQLTSQTQQLNESNVSLQRSNYELEQFAYVASHDLQEPLRMVGNFVQLLEEEMDEKINEEEKMYVSYIVDGVTRMSLLIDDLLQYSRIGRSDMVFDTFDLKKVIDDKLMDLSLKIKESNAIIEKDNLPDILYGEPNQLGIVFHNLIHNGLKFNDSSAPKIIISCQKQNNKYLFSIKDNGIGIDPKNHNKIFEVFKRLHRKEEYPGTGIGLSLVKRIILGHGGDIWIESAVGKGTTFFFTIPLKNTNSNSNPNSI